ncbi:cyclase [Sphaerisporangium siamense]|uniref:Ribosome-associated toxin RatA of RatAB toxin-antitoxin module n=1 Tax=Sphaerisporangium siamense TaxID=795645 RepID=A0A7W7GDF2_9ACTN|nr:SRPBCC family protein [Sphaerisporangium siamense]MBB4704905.1 ribosome-associated toxin RatA of RatAB toxin-antitoxin module [Sphaerisporangium siamense]GII83707.1 cyclase [Sphaerisporangium siamense]
MADRTISSITIAADPTAIVAVIADFPAYPEWAGQVKAAKILSVGEDGRPAAVRFSLDAGMISDEYTLGYTWRGDEAVDWHIVESGKMLSALTGAYRLVPAGNATEVTYELAVDLKVPMIGMVKRKAEKVIVDTALKGLKKRVEGR